MTEYGDDKNVARGESATRPRGNSSGWACVDTRSVSPTKSDSLCSMLMENRVEVPNLQGTVSSGESAQGSRNYSREFLSNFLNQYSDNTTDEEFALGQAIQTNMSPNRHQEGFVGDSPTRKKKLKKKLKKKKKTSVDYKSTASSVEEDYGAWQDKKGAFHFSPNISLSTGDSTPRTRNVEAAEIKSPTPELITLGSTRSPQTPLILHTPIVSHLPSRDATHTFDVSPQNAVSVQSDLTELLHQEQPRSKKHQKQSSEKNIEVKQAVSEQMAMLAASTNNESARHKRSVSFDKVSIRYYERILSINPSCTSGPPLGLGWRFARERHYQIDGFELHRMRSRRDKTGLVLPRQVRERMLLELGYDRMEVAKAVRLTIRSQHQRKQTVTNLGAALFEEKLELARKQLKNLFVSRK
jgi:hypothetical protein